jgi:branched-chain amino acid transport system ATP-binding protein
MSDQFIFTQNLSKEFGGIQALRSLNFSIHQGEIHGVIGPNGAGKTTLINVITGLEKPSTGRVFFQGKEIDQLPPEIIFEMGISRTFQDGKIVSGLTVLENVMIGLFNQEKEYQKDRSVLSKWFGQFRQEHETKAKGREILKRFELQSLANRWADDLVWFERQLVQIARAIASKPQFLLLDEPTAGMGISEKRMIGNKLKEINQSGVTIMLISHDMHFIRRVAQRITVLDFGQKISEGMFQQVLSDPSVWEAYFGAGYVEGAGRRDI